MRLVDKDDLLREIETMSCIDQDSAHCEETTCYQCYMNLVEFQPEVDPAEQRYGHWKEDYTGDFFYCSECGIGSKCQTNYCPYCGVKMTDAQGDFNVCR